MPVGPEPVIAVAAGPDAWYCWLAPHLLDRQQPATVRAPDLRSLWVSGVAGRRGKDCRAPSPTLQGGGVARQCVCVCGGGSAHTHQMMPMPSTRPRLLVGHNVSFDRARVLDEYQLDGTSSRFLDTMSLHMAVAGLTSQQRGIWKKAMKERRDDAAAATMGAVGSADGEGGDAGAPSAAELPWAVFGNGGPAGGDADAPAWLDAGATNSLQEVYGFHCGGHIDKSTRDIFLDGTLDAIQADLPALITYCATDVLRTHEVLAKVLPRFLTKCPHPVTFAGMLEMSLCYLPVNDGWLRYIERAEAKFEQLSSTLAARLRHMTDAALAGGPDAAKVRRPVPGARAR